jgi:hypothetical protein
MRLFGMLIYSEKGREGRERGKKMDSYLDESRGTAGCDEAVFAASATMADVERERSEESAARERKTARSIAVERGE